MSITRVFQSPAGDPAGAGGWGSPPGPGGSTLVSPLAAGTVPASGVPSQLITFPPEYFPPDNANDFFAQGYNAGQISATGVVVLGAFQVPQSERGVIRSLVVGVGNYTAAGFVNFQIRFNGFPAPGWGNIIVAPQPAAFVSVSFAPEEMGVRVPLGALVQVTGQITAGGPFDMFASLHGWSWGTLR